MQLWKVYIGVTNIRLKQIVKEHWDICKRSDKMASAIAKDDKQQRIKWDEIGVVDKS